MSLFHRIFGKKSHLPPDPTVEWPSSGDRELLLVPHEGRFGDLTLGCSIDDARPLGKPSRFRWIQNDYCELLYARSGFQIDFDSGRLAYIAFFLNQHIAQPDIESRSHLAVVSLRLADGRSGQLSKESTRVVIEGYFGSPTLVDTDDDETILHYKVRGITMEFEMHLVSHSLMRFNIYRTTDG